MVVWISVLAACATPQRVPPASITTPAREAQNGLDTVSAVRSDNPYDWRNLAVAPFGSTLNDLKSSSHEVVLFDDVPDEECRALDDERPNFLSGTADSYLLCFHHDRLVRFEVAAQVPAADAEALLSKVCAAGLIKMTVLPSSEGNCQGSDGTVKFAASLAEAAGGDSDAGGADARAARPGDTVQPKPINEPPQWLTVTVSDDLKAAP